MRRLKEKSLSRVFQHMQEHDTGFVTAYRGDLSHRENAARNKVLLARIQDKGYGVTSVEGAYIENYKTPTALTVSEHTFFVVDLGDRGNLKNDIYEFGRYGSDENLEQDSVLFVPKGADVGIIIGTREDAWPGLGEKTLLRRPVFGVEDEFHTKVGNRPLHFPQMGESIREHPNPTGQWGKAACRNIARSDWKKLIR